jgi:hypothetical protein
LELTTNQSPEAIAHLYGLVGPEQSLQNEEDHVPGCRDVEMQRMQEVQEFQGQIMQGCAGKQRSVGDLGKSLKQEQENLMDELETGEMDARFDDSGQQLRWLELLENQHNQLEDEKELLIAMELLEEDQGI